MSSAAIMQQSVTARVPAKVNLELMVGPRRPDGFHLLSTVFQAVGLHDDVRVEPAEEWGITVNGPYAGLVPADESNLALRAAGVDPRTRGERLDIHAFAAIAAARAAVVSR